MQNELQNLDGTRLNVCHAYRNLSPLFCSTFPTSDSMMGMFCLGVFKLRNSAQSYPLECQYHQLTSFSVHEVGNKRCSLQLLYQRHTKLSPVYPQVYWGFTTGFVAMCLSINVSTKDRICIAHEHINTQGTHLKKSKQNENFNKHHQGYIWFVGHLCQKMGRAVITGMGTD